MIWKWQWNVRNVGIEVKKVNLIWGDLCFQRWIKIEKDYKIHLVELPKNIYSKEVDAWKDEKFKSFAEQENQAFVSFDFSSFINFL